MQIILGLVFPIAFILSLCIYGIWAAGIEERDRVATHVGLGGILFWCILSVYACFEDLIKTKISLERARFWDFHEKTLINALAESEVKSKTEIAKNLKKSRYYAENNRPNHGVNYRRNRENELTLESAKRKMNLTAIIFKSDDFFISL